MKPFKFRLQGYLKIKEFEEKIALSDFLAQESVVTKIRTQIETIDNQLHKANKVYSTYGSAQGAITNMAQMYEQMSLALVKKKEYLYQDLEKENQLLEKLFLIYAEKKKNTKIISLYKDKKNKKHRKEQKRQESKQADEIAQNFKGQWGKYESL